MSEQQDAVVELDADVRDEFIAFSAAVLVTLQSALEVGWRDMGDIIDDLKRTAADPDLPEYLMVLGPCLKVRFWDRLAGCLEQLEAVKTSGDLFPADEFLRETFGAFLWQMGVTSGHLPVGQIEDGG